MQANVVGYPRPQYNRAQPARRNAVSAGVGALAAAIGLIKKGRRVNKPSNTQTKKKSIFSGVSSTPSGESSLSYFKTGRKKPSKQNKLTLKPLEPTHYVYNSALRCSNTVGKQEYFPLGSYFDTGFLGAIQAQIALNKNETTVSAANKKVFYSNVSAEIMFTNQSLATARINIYDVVARRDLINANTQSPIFALQALMADMPLPSMTGYNLAADYQIIGTNPFHNKAFCQFFKVKKVTNLELSQGQNHIHRVSHQPQRWFTTEMLKYCTYGVKNLTAFTFICLSGIPANDTTTKTTATVTLGARTLDIVTRYSMKYYYMDEGTPKFVYTNNLPTSFAVGESIVNIGSGEPDTNENT